MARKRRSGRRKKLWMFKVASLFFIMLAGFVICNIITQRIYESTSDWGIADKWVLDIIVVLIIFGLAFIFSWLYDRKAKIGKTAVNVLDG